MAVMVRRLHMGCGETLQSHLPESFTEMLKQKSINSHGQNNRQLKQGRKGRFCK